MRLTIAAGACVIASLLLFAVMSIRVDAQSGTQPPDNHPAGYTGGSGTILPVARRVWPTMTPTVLPFTVTDTPEATDTPTVLPTPTDVPTPAPEDVEPWPDQPVGPSK